MPFPRCRTLVATLAVTAVSLAAAPTGAQQPDAFGDKTVAATVNGTPITVGQWVRRMSRLTLNDFGVRGGATMTAGQIALQLLINQQVVMQYAAKTGLTATPDEVETALKAQKARPGFQTSLSDDELRDEIRYQRTLFNFATVNQRITPEEARAYYEQNFGAKFQIALIRAASRADADAAYAALGKGTPFTEVAAKYSNDPATKASGGEIRGPDGKPQWISARAGGLPPFVVDAVNKLKSPGDYTPVISAASPDGRQAAYFIVRLLGRFQPTDSDYEKVRPEMEREALFAKMIRSGEAEKKLNEARSAAKIVVSLPGYGS